MSQVQPYRDLWVSVIARAVLDAVGHAHGNKSPGATRAAQRAARQWLTDNSADFRNVCALAGVDPEAILRVTRSGQLDALVAAYRNRFNSWNANDV